MKRIVVLFFLLSIGVQSFSQDENVEKKEDKNAELKEQSVYTEEEKKDSVEIIPKSFTLDPMSNGVRSVTPSNAQGNLSGEVQASEINDSVWTETLTVSPEPSSPSKAEIRKQQQEEIQTLSDGNKHSGGFGALSFKATKFNDKNIVLAGIRGGWIINRTVAIGIEGYGIIPTGEYPDIDPIFNTRAVGGYGGLFIEPILFSNNIVHVTFPIASGAGWLGYVTDWEQTYYHDSYLVDDDVYWYFEPGVGIELNVARSFRVAMGATYRITQDLELVNTDANAFDDWNYFLTLKFGKF